MKRAIIIGSRESRLAVAQTQLVIDELRRINPELEIRLLTLKTTGDKILNRTLEEIGGKGLFVRELDEALLDGRIDLAVHSLKDLPMELHPDLPLAALPRRGDPRDALVFPAAGEQSLHVVGTSSARRRLQAASLYPGAAFQPVRGNINTRLSKLDGGEYSALILAAAGLVRAGLANRISRLFAPEEILPAAGQGILAVQCRKDFDRGLLTPLNHRETELAALAERSFVRALDGRCTSPAAAYAEVWGNELRITGFYADPEGSFQLRGTLTGQVEEAEALGVRLAEELKEKIQ